MAWHAGVPIKDDPFTNVFDLAMEAPPHNPYLCGKLTATYPEVWDAALGRMVITNYPNQGATRSNALQTRSLPFLGFVLL